MGEFLEDICLARTRGGEFAELAARLRLESVENFLADAPNAPADFPDFAYASPEAPRLIVFERSYPARGDGRGCTMGVYDGDPELVLERIHAAYALGLADVAEPMGDIDPPTPQGVDAGMYNLYMDGDGVRYALRITSDAERILDMSTRGEALVLSPVSGAARQGFTVTILAVDME
ncbi:MAG: hypothetical protein RKE49_06640 [Oceanicaulis sp.]